MSDKTVNQVKVKVMWVVVICPLCRAENGMVEDPRGTPHQCYVCKEKLDIDADAELQLVF
jgi:hypothetical protein